MSKNKAINTPQKNTVALREWVKFCLHLKGYTLKSFGQRHGVTAGTVGVVFSRPFPRMEKLIADILETPPQNLWPSRYGEDGLPNRENAWYARGKTGQRYQKKELKSKKIGKVKNGTKN
jgi:Ner family transcriptional regulator